MFASQFATREIPQPDAPANAPPVYKNVSFIEYTPALNYVGGDSFSIIICDNNEDGLAALNAYASSLPSLSSTLASLSCTSAQTSEFVQVQLTVVNINDAPFSTPTSYIVQVFPMTFTHVLANN